MKPQYQHELMTSFSLWFDHELLQKGEAYSNKTGTLYAQSDSRLPNSYISLQSDYKQWVNDSSITGEVNPIIPTDFQGSGRSNDIIFDFDNGRLIETGSVFSAGNTLTGSFSVKDFNVYLSNESEEDLITENKFKLNSRYGTPTISGIEPYAQVVPAIFLNCEYMRNEGFAFGGEDRSVNTIKAVVLAEDSYQLDGALSIFADSARKVFQKIPFSAHSLTEYGDIKGGVYNYTGLAHTYSSQNPFVIEDVSVSKLSSKAQDKIPGDLYIGFIDFEVSTTRYPRS